MQNPFISIVSLAILSLIITNNSFGQEETSQINWFVGNTEAGEWIEYKKVWLSEGNYRFTSQVQAEKENQQIQFEIDGAAILAKVEIPLTDTFTLVHLGSKYLSEGYYNLRLVFLSGNVNCDMFFVKKDANIASSVLPGDIEYSASALKDGMMVAPIGAQSIASGSMIKVGGNPWLYNDKKGNPFTQEQILAWYKQQAYSYTPKNSDQAMDMWVAELVASKPDFVFMHGRGATDFTNDIEDRDYKYGVGALDGRLLKRFVEAVNRSPYAKGNIRMAYFQDNASFALAYNWETGKTMPSWDDPEWMDFTWEHWFKAWYDNVPLEMLYQPEPGKIPIQLWTANLTDFNNTGSSKKIKEFLEFISAKMIETYNLEPLWVLSETFNHRDPRTDALKWGHQSWFSWSGDCTSMNEYNGSDWAFAVNGKRYPFNGCFLNDWDPQTGLGTVPDGGSYNDYKVSALLPDGTPLLKDFFQSSREANAKWIVLESWSDWQEGTAWYRSDHEEWEYPNQHLALAREYADRNTESLVFEAEACDVFYDNSFRNSGGEYRYHWHTNGEPDLDIYRPVHILSEIENFGKPTHIFSKLAVGFQDVWAITTSNTIISCEVDGSPAEWHDVTKQMDLSDLSMGNAYAWAIGSDGNTYRATLPQSWDHYNSNSWEDVGDGKKMKDIDINWKEAWGIDEQGKVFMKNLDGDAPWKEKPGAILQSITVDDAFIWGQNADGNFLITRTEGSVGWDTIANPHNISTIDAGGGELWGTNASGELYRTSASGISNWELINSNISSFSVGWEYAWLIDNEGNALQYELYGFDNQLSYQTHQTKSRISHSIPGTIQAEHFNNGGKDIAYHDIDDINQGDQYRVLEGVDILKTTDKDGAYEIAWTADGEWLEYDISDIKAGTYTINFRLASDSDNKSITLSLGGEELAILSIPNTGGLDQWQNILLSNIAITTDTASVLRIHFNGGGVNVNYLTFFEGQAPSVYNILPGTIEAENFDFGGEGISYHDSDIENKGMEYRPFESVDILTSNDERGDFCVAWISDSEYLEYTIDDIVAGKYAMTFRIANNGGENQSISASLDNVDLGSIDVPDTGGDEIWQTIKLSDIVFNDGSDKVLRLTFNGGGYKLNYISVFIDQLAYTTHVIPGIIEAEHYDIGGEGIAYHDQEAEFLGNASFRTDEGVDIGNTNDNGAALFLGWTNNEWTEYTISSITGGQYNIEFRVASPLNDKTIDLILDGESLGTVTVPNTGDWTNWQTASLNDVTVIGGEDKVMRISHNGGFNINYIKFSEYIISNNYFETESFDIDIYPNPASDEEITARFTLVEASDISISIMDISGRTLGQSIDNMNFETGSHELKVPVYGMNPGTYLIKISVNKKVYTKLLLIK